MLDRDSALEGNGAGEVERRGPPGGRLVLEVLARAPIDGRGAGLVRRHLDARHLRGVGTVEVDQGAPRIDRADNRSDAALGGRLRRRLGRELRPVLREDRHLGGRELAHRPRDRAGFVLVGRLTAGTDRSDDLVADLERDAAGEAGGTVERERAEAAARHLLLHLAARAHEDRRGACLVERDARACDLSARGAAHPDQLSGGVDDGDHHPVTVVVGVLLGGGDHRVRAGVVDRLSSPDDCHRSRSCYLGAPLLARTAAQIASSAVMKRTLRSGPPKVKLTAPGSAISPISSPLASKTCTPLAADA
jgi:hypothetical protein